ncbi:MAG: hypothetical protein K2L33_02105 [Muribaculaceae bacterium]|nr:hypothetical protein [Muribaculaceae bacterium]
MKKLLLTLLAVITVGFYGMAETIDLSFATIGTTGWSNSYAAHTYETTDVTVKFTACSKQTGTITTHPVTKAGPVVFSLKNEGSFSTAKVTLKQWTTKTKTAKLEYSTNGTTFTAFSPAVSSSTFEVEATSIPEGTTAIRLSFTESSNQVAIVSFEYTLAGQVEKNEATLSWSKEAETINLGDEFSAPVLTCTPADAEADIVYTSSNESLLAVDANGRMTLTEGATGTAVITASLNPSSNFSATPAVYTLTVKDPNAKPFTLVTDATQLTDGAKVIIVNATAGKALGKIQATNDRNAVNVEIIDNEINPENDVEIITLEANAGNWAFLTSTGYLAAGSSSSNSLKTQENLVDATVSISTNNDASIKFTNFTTRNLLQYNTSSDFFRCYSNAQTNGSVQLYMQPAATVAVEPELSVTAGETVLENDGEYTFEEGTEISIHAENATSIVVIDIENNEIVNVDGQDASFVPAVGENMYTITASNGDKSVEISFTTTVTAKAISVPQVFIGETEILDAETINLNESEVTVTIKAADAAHHIYHKFTNQPGSEEEEEIATVANEITDENGFVKNEASEVELTLSKNGTLEIYAHHPESGLKSAVMTLMVTGANTTAIAEVGAEANVAAEWFDMQGRRVAVPAKGGVYIIKQGSKTSKRAL